MISFISLISKKAERTETVGEKICACEAYRKVQMAWENWIYLGQKLACFQNQFLCIVEKNELLLSLRSFLWNNNCGESNLVCQYREEFSRRES
jgi:hypothetical protein